MAINPHCPNCSQPLLTSPGAARPTRCPFCDEPLVTTGLATAVPAVSPTPPDQPRSGSSAPSAGPSWWVGDEAPRPAATVPAPTPAPRSSIRTPAPVVSPPPAAPL